MRVWNVPARIHAETSDWLIDARTSQRPVAAGAPIDRYATPRGAKSLKSSGPAACDEVVSRFTSPENGVPVKKLVARFAALSKARPKIDAGAPSGIPWSTAAPAKQTPQPPSL